MGRAERRKAERKNRIENRKNQVTMSRQEIGEMKNDLVSSTSKYDVEALMTCFALAEHRLYGFGSKRVLRTLQYIDDLMGDIVNNSATIEDYKKLVKEEVGIAIEG